jgi:quercetin dioxygenase-like cupin family protein
MQTNISSAKQALIIKPEETRSAQPLNILGDRIWVKLSGEDTEGSYAIMENVSQPRQGPPLHRHTREDESFYVLEGEFVFEVDGERIPAGPGCSVYAPRGTAHTFQNAGNTPGRLLVVVQPAGLDNFFADLDAATRGRNEPELSVIAPVFERHGLELLGPPLSALRRP